MSAALMPYLCPEEAKLHAICKKQDKMNKNILSGNGQATHIIVMRLITQIKFQREIIPVLDTEIDKLVRLE